MKVSKWGDSRAVRLPAAEVRALQLKAGDEIEIRIAGAREFGVARKRGRQDLLDQLRAYRARLPRDFKFDREERTPDDPFARAADEASTRLPTVLDRRAG
jgi:antitoxin MazE